MLQDPLRVLAWRMTRRTHHEPVPIEKGGGLVVSHAPAPPAACGCRLGLPEILRPCLPEVPPGGTSIYRSLLPPIY
jgi:hypothetical protein